MTDTWTLEDAVVSIENERPFYHCEVTVERDIEERRNLPPTEDYSGEIQFSEPIPDDLFFEDDGSPFIFDVDVESEKMVGELEDVIFTSRKDKTEVGFCASDGEIRSNDQYECVVDTDRHAVNLLDNLACDIVDGDAHVVSIDRDEEFDDSGVSTLEVAYQ